MNHTSRFILIVILLLLAWDFFLLTTLRRCSWSQSGSPLRFLLIGDPQLEGDTSNRHKDGLTNFITWLNDHYMKFIVDTLVSTLHPTHVAVMGDLYSSQYLSDTDFYARLPRYTHIFDLASTQSIIINVTGNHDLGYGDEMPRSRLQRFEKVFGNANFLLPYPLGADFDKDSIIDEAPIAVINNLLLDPAREAEERDKVWSFLHHVADVFQQHPNQPRILLSHVPLYKSGGCVDHPQHRWSQQGFVLQQNQLSINATDYLVNELAPTIILTGHDHHGCAYTHAKKDGKGTVQEYTIRSIMGDYAGAGALLSFHATPHGQWTHSFAYCHFPPFKMMTFTAVLHLTMGIFSAFYFGFKPRSTTVASKSR